MGNELLRPLLSPALVSCTISLLAFLILCADLCISSIASGSSLRPTLNLIFEGIVSDTMLNLSFLSFVTTASLMTIILLIINSEEKMAFTTLSWRPDRWKRLQHRVIKPCVLVNLTLSPLLLAANIFNLLNRAQLVSPPTKHIAQLTSINHSNSAVPLLVISVWAISIGLLGFHLMISDLNLSKARRWRDTLDDASKPEETIFILQNLITRELSRRNYNVANQLSEDLLKVATELPKAQSL